MCVYLLCDQPCTTLPFMSSFSTRFLIDSYKFVTSQQGVPRGLQGPLAGCGARKPGGLPGTALLPHPAAGGGARDMTNYIDLPTHSTGSDGIYSPSELLHTTQKTGPHRPCLNDQ